MSYDVFIKNMLSLFNEALVISLSIAWQEYPQQSSGGFSLFSDFSLLLPVGFKGGTLMHVKFEDQDKKCNFPGLWTLKPGQVKFIFEI